MIDKLYIGLTGPAKAGKSTIARQLGFIAQEVEFGKGSTISFASPLREMAYKFMKAAGVHNPDEAMADDLRKEVELNDLGGCSPRWILQSLGTEWGRECIHPDIWVQIAARRAAAARAELIVFDDVRFENECEFIRSHGGLIVKLHRHEAGIRGEHKSEQGVVPDIIVSNNNSPQQCAKTVWEEAYANCAKLAVD
jgi:hypothetical protein